MSDVPPRPRIRPATSDDWESPDRSGRGAQFGPQGQGHGSNPADADFDGSTYYEYIERHTGDLPVSRTRQSNVFARAGSSPFQDRLGASVDRSGPDSDPRRGGPGPSSGSGGFPAVGQNSDSGGFGAVGYGTDGPNSGMGPAAAGSVPRRSTGAKVVVVIIAILMVLGLLGYFGVRWLAPSSGTMPAEVGSDESGSAAPSPSDELVQPSASPEEELDSFVRSGNEKAADLEGQWVTQVSAKKVGLEADGRTWSAQDILDEFKANQVKYPGSILIYSGDWNSYKFGDYWVTVVATPHDSPKPALEQCRSWGLDRDHCLAKRLVKDGEYSSDDSAYLDG